MLLRMLEVGCKVDEVLFCDTGVEFPQIYDHVSKVKEEVESQGVRFVTFKAEHGFRWYLTEKPVESKTYGSHKGYGWPGFYSRWCTKHLKTALMDSYIKGLGADAVRCVGIAADEPQRIRGGCRYPLMEWGWTEKLALGYCYGKGYDFGGLYECFSRCGCYLCPFQSLKSLSALRENFPLFWSEIRRMEERAVKNGTPNPLYRGEGWEALDERLAKGSSSGQSSLSEFGIAGLL